MELEITKINIGKRQRKEFTGIENLAESIKVHGLLHPIVVTRDMRLVAGERRIKAYMLLERKSIPANFYEDCDEITLRELELEENLMREDMTWDEVNTARAELHFLKQEKYGAAQQGAKDSGWTLQQTADLVGISKGHTSEEIKLFEAKQQFPELKTFNTKRQALRMMHKLREQAILMELASRRKGDMMEESEWKLHNTDCREVMKGMADESVDLIITDPPWGIEIHESGGHLTGADKPAFQDDAASVWQLMDECIPEFFRVLKVDSHLYIFFGIEFHTKLVGLLTAAGFEARVVPIIWDKKSPRLATDDYHFSTQYEFIMYASKGARRLNDFSGDLLSYPRPASMDRIHETEKPIELLKYLIKLSSVQDELIFDPFAGSGSTLRAAVLSGRRAIGTEIKEEYYAPALQSLVYGVDIEEGESNG